MNGAIYKGEEVFTIGQVCEMLGKDKDTVKAYVKNHKSVFVEDVDYFRLSKADVLDLRKRLAGTEVYRFYATNPNNVRAYTQAGIDKLAKIYKVPGHVVSALEKAVEVFGSESTADARAIEDVIRFNNEMVDGRSLHEFLGVKTRYNDWFPRMVEAGDFIEGEDYYSNLSKEIPLVDNSMNQDLTMDMAKEICMLQHNERGKQARRYFIECEKRLKASQPSYMIEDAIARARAWANEQEASRKKLLEQTKTIEERDKTIEEMKPLAMLGKAVSTTTEIYIGDLAKILTQNGVIIGRNNLFKRLRNEGYITNYGGSKNMPTQRYMKAGYFRVKEGVREDPRTGELIPFMTTMVTGKGQQFFINKFMMEGQDA